MKLILLPSVLTILGIFMGFFDKVWKYFIFFFFVLGVNYAFSEPISDVEYEKQALNYYFVPKTYKLSETAKLHYQALAIRNLRTAEKLLNTSLELSLFIPDDEFREMAHVAITAAIGGIASKTITGAGMCALVTIVTQYACSVYDRWEDLQYNLLEAQHSFEMYEFYVYVLENDENYIDDDELMVSSIQNHSLAIPSN